MRIPGVKTAKTLARWVQARVLGGAIILGYHRVANVVRDEYEICVTLDHFAEQMEVVSRYLHPVSLSMLVQYLRAGTIPQKTVAVTFDDGYSDNLYQAKPILEKYAVPATVFVCTGYSGKEFWWDELERLVMSSQADLHTLRLLVGEDRFAWDQSNARIGAGDREDRSRFHHALYHFLLPLDKADQNHVLNKIRGWSGISPDETPASRAMDHHELVQLVDGGLIELGSHTRNHLMLPLLSRAQKREEIIIGKRDLELLLGKQIDGFAYPNGRASEDVKKIVQEAGFTFACTSLHDVVRPGKDKYEMTRFWQKNVDGEKFLHGLYSWMKLF